MLKKNKYQKAFIDPISLIGIGFLLITLVVGIAVTNNPVKQLLINSRARGNLGDDGKASGRVTSARDIGNAHDRNEALSNEVIPVTTVNVNGQNVVTTYRNSNGVVTTVYTPEQIEALTHPPELAQPDYSGLSINQVTGNTGNVFNGNQAYTDQINTQLRNITASNFTPPNPVNNPNGNSIPNISISPSLQTATNNIYDESYAANLRPNIQTIQTPEQIANNVTPNTVYSGTPTQQFTLSSILNSISTNLSNSFENSSLDGLGTYGLGGGNAPVVNLPESALGTTGPKVNFEPIPGVQTHMQVTQGFQDWVTGNQIFAAGGSVVGAGTLTGAELLSSSMSIWSLAGGSLENLPAAAATYTSGSTLVGTLAGASPILSALTVTSLTLGGVDCALHGSGSNFCQAAGDMAFQGFSLDPAGFTQMFNQGAQVYGDTYAVFSNIQKIPSTSTNSVATQLDRPNVIDGSFVDDFTGLSANSNSPVAYSPQSSVEVIVNNEIPNTMTTISTIGSNIGTSSVNNQMLFALATGLNPSALGVGTNTTNLTNSANDLNTLLLGSHTSPSPAQNTPSVALTNLWNNTLENLANSINLTPISNIDLPQTQTIADQVGSAIADNIQVNPPASQQPTSVWLENLNDSLTNLFSIPPATQYNTGPITPVTNIQLGDSLLIGSAESAVDFPIGNSWPEGTGNLNVIPNTSNNTLVVQINNLNGNQVASVINAGDTIGALPDGSLVNLSNTPAGIETNPVFSFQGLDNNGIPIINALGTPTAPSLPNQIISSVQNAVTNFINNPLGSLGINIPNSTSPALINAENIQYAFSPFEGSDLDLRTPDGKQVVVTYELGRGKEGVVYMGKFKDGDNWVKVIVKKSIEGADPSVLENQIKLFKDIRSEILKSRNTELIDRIARPFGTIYDTDGKLTGYIRTIADGNALMENGAINGKLSPKDISDFDEFIRICDTAHIPINDLYPTNIFGFEGNYKIIDLTPEQNVPKGAVVGHVIDSTQPNFDYDYGIENDITYNDPDKGLVYVTNPEGQTNLQRFNNMVRFFGLSDSTPPSNFAGITTVVQNDANSIIPVVNNIPSQIMSWVENSLAGLIVNPTTNLVNELPNSKLPSTLNSSTYVPVNKANEVAKYFSDNYSPSDARFMKYSGGSYVQGFRFEYDGNEYILKILTYQSETKDYIANSIRGQDYISQNGLPVDPITFIRNPDGRTVGVQRFVDGDELFLDGSKRSSEVIKYFADHNIGIHDLNTNIIDSPDGPRIVDFQDVYLINNNSAASFFASQPTGLVAGVQNTIGKIEVYANDALNAVKAWNPLNNVNWFGDKPVTDNQIGHATNPIVVIDSPFNPIQTRPKPTTYSPIINSGGFQTNPVIQTVVDTAWGGNPTGQFISSSPTFDIYKIIVITSGAGIVAYDEYQQSHGGVGIGQETINLFNSFANLFTHPSAQGVTNLADSIKASVYSSVDVSNMAQNNKPDQDSNNEALNKIDIYRQRDNPNLKINKWGTTMLELGCTPSSAINALRLLGYDLTDEQIQEIIDNLYWDPTTHQTGAGAVLLSLQQHEINGAVNYGNSHRIIDANLINKFTGILVYGGTASSPSESLAHTALITCNKGNCYSIDSYFGNGTPTKCEVQSSNSIQCGDYNYHVGENGGTPDALFPVIGSDKNAILPSEPNLDSNNQDSSSITTAAIPEVKTNDTVVKQPENLFNNNATYAVLKNSNNIPYHIVYIDPNHAQFYVDSSTGREITSNFLKDKGLDIAINGDGWEYVEDDYGIVHLQSQGLTISKGTTYYSYKKDGSPYISKKEETIYFDENNKIYFNKPDNSVTITNAISYPNRLIRDGVIVPHPDKVDYNPRTAIGVKGDGTIILISSEGSEYGSGMTVADLTDVLVKQDVVNAAMFDSGSSSTMVINGQGIVNNPSCDTNTKECLVVNHLGIKITP
jgi:exopolysaccharide biosynthesis protein